MLKGVDNPEMENRIVNRIINNIMIFLKHILVVIVLFNFTINSQHEQGLLYIGEWTPPGQIKLGYPDLKVGQQGFIKRNCPFTNCFYTNDRQFANLIHYDALLFNVKILNEMYYYVATPPNNTRTKHQLLIFVGFEPAVQYPIVQTENSYDLTWTYKLASDVVRPFFIVKNNRSEVIGPRKYMQWVTNVKDMALINKQLRHKIKDKSVAAAFISSQCETRSNRQQFVDKLQNELSKHGHRIDIYGSCGSLQCEMDNRTGNSQCSDLIREKYYFYLAFETALGEDYVTDQVLYALNNYAVPVVYGGANYTRFMPDGIYLNARLLGVEKLASKMTEIINHPFDYFEYFKWHRYYSFHDITTEKRYDGICDLCAILNNNTREPKGDLIKFWNAAPLISLT